MTMSRRLRSGGCLLLSVVLLLALSLGNTRALAASATPHATRTKPAAGAKAHKAHKAAKPAVKADVVGWLKLSGSLRDRPVPFAWVDQAEAGPSLQGVLRQLDTVARQPRYEGVVIYLDQPTLSLAQVDAIANAMHQVRQAGKKVLVFSMAYDLKSYLLATNADLILLQHKGTVELAGISMQEMYLAGLLKKVGVKADLMQIGRYKGAEEPLTRTGPSKFWSENIDHLLDDFYAQILEQIGHNRHWTNKQVEAVMHDSWTMSDADCLKRGVVDRLVDRDLQAVTEVQFGDAFAWDDSMGLSKGGAMAAQNPFALLQMLFQPSDAGRTRRATVAVLHATGPITSGDSSVASGPFSANTIGSRSFVKTLGKLRDDPNVKGVVIRLDSPGGSALASEVIWQAIRDLADHKPVYVSVGSMAASGGYYMSCACDEIYVSPASIVGSIGVVGGKITLGGLYKKLGIDVYERSRGPLSGMFSSSEPFTPEERKAMEAGLKRVYQQFLDRVHTGRGKRLADVTKVAAGRVFSGRQAVANGMADHIGDQREAVRDMAKQLHLAKGHYDVLEYPSPMSLGDYLNSMFGVHSPKIDMRAPALPAGLVETARAVLGVQAWTEARQVLTGLLQLRGESALTLMPCAIVLR